MGKNGWELYPNPAGPPHSQTFIHHKKKLAAIVSQDGGRWHMSVSHKDRVPTWGELGFARDSLLPADIWLMVPHPPRRYWLNYDRRVLHMWEFVDEYLEAQFRFEGELARAEGYSTPDDGRDLNA